MLDTHQKNIATFIHLSTFSRFIIPFGNFIGPLLLWITNKEKSEFVDAHGKQALNFQISVLLYAIILGALTIPFLIFGFLGHIDLLSFNSFDNIQFDFHSASPLLFIAGGFGFLAVTGFLLELVFIVIASLKARDGELYKYPLTINFLK
ncbi:DUF4870 domain-containing protein [Gelidibacter sp.]|uniref:DUF4870 domain-containing protein n=1 Tax=Gelidibacter sp. TaxID=2018083 RepID=UPI002CA659CF|nr:DUF4870 domain-containing protein [Gelidibacter sp.]HUH26975.1 DUF4870 domain-containing protein [Gelidibacter sp.]